MNQTVEKRLDGASVGDWIRNNTNLLLMFALIIVGALTSDNFFSMDNILNVLRRNTVNGMLAVACTMTLLVGGFDLSIGHVMALSAVLCIGFEKSTGSGAVGIVVALAAGLVLGLINGLLMKLTRGGSGEGFMITLATGMMAQALAKWYCAGSEIIRIDLPAEIDWFKQLGQGNLLGFPICTLIWIAVMVILQIVIKKTTFGRQMLLTAQTRNRPSSPVSTSTASRSSPIPWRASAAASRRSSMPPVSPARQTARASAATSTARSAPSSAATPSTAATAAWCRCSSVR